MRRIIYLALISMAGCTPTNVDLDKNFSFSEVSYLGPLDDATNNGDGVITGKTSDSAVKAAILPPLKESLATFKGSVPHALDIKCRVQLPTQFTQAVSLLTNAFLICEYGIKNLRTGVEVIKDRPANAVLLVTPGKAKSEVLYEIGVKLASTVKKDLYRLSK